MARHAVANGGLPPAIARPSLLRSEIAAGILHRELTPLTHSSRPLARRRPHLHRGVCVCVCVCVCVFVCVCVCVFVCNIRLFDLLSTPHYLRSQRAPSSHILCYPSDTPTPRSPFLYADNYPSPCPSPCPLLLSSIPYFSPIFSHARVRTVPSLIHPSALVASGCSLLC